MCTTCGCAGGGVEGMATKGTSGRMSTRDMATTTGMATITGIRTKDTIERTRTEAVP